MKYFAILKDSFREALASKVLYVLVGLSSLGILFVASISFKALPAETTMHGILRGEVHFTLNQLKPEVLQQGKKEDANLFGFINPQTLVPRFDLVKVELLRGEPDSYASAYRLTMRKFVGVDDDGVPLLTPAQVLAEAHKVFELLEELGLIGVEDVRLAQDEALVAKMKGPTANLYVQVATKPGPGSARLWYSQPMLFFGLWPLESAGIPVSVPTGNFLYTATGILMSWGSWIALLTAVIITSFFIPNMLRKGTIDFLLVKPISRTMLLIYKYLGGLTFILLNNAYAIMGIWLVLGLRTGVWANSFLLLIIVLTFFFAILYSISTLIGVLTRSTIVAIMVTCVAWFVFFLVGLGFQFVDAMGRMEHVRNVAEEDRHSESGLAKAVKVAHFILPRTSDLNYLATVLIYSDFMTGSLAKTRELDSSSFNWGETLGVSAGFIALMLALACWRFAARDY